MKKMSDVMMSDILYKLRYFPANCIKKSPCYHFQGELIVIIKKFRDLGHLYNLVRQRL